MTLQEILADIHAIEEDLLAFERKYGIRSEFFYAAYVSGEEPEDDSWVLDFGEWARACIVLGLRGRLDVPGTLHHVCQRDRQTLIPLLYT